LACSLGAPESAAAKAEGLVRAGLNELGSRRRNRRHPKCDPAKVKLAMQVRAETTVTLKWKRRVSHAFDGRGITL